jgi:hypothetical protein
VAIKPDAAEVLIRRATATRLRAAGMTYAVIAEQVGYASASGAHAAVMALLRESASEVADEMRLVENARLDSWQAALAPACTRGNVRAIEAALKVSARRCRLNGLDAPIPIAVSPALRDDIADAFEQLRASVLTAPPYDPDHLPD